MDSWAAIEDSRERVQSSSTATEKAKEYVNRKGLSIEYRHFGSVAEVTTCTISDSTGFKTEGHGKGVGIQATASAIFEALEHFYYFKEDPRAIVSCSELNLNGNGSYLIGGSPPVEKMLACDASSPLNCTLFSSILQPERAVDFPISLLNPYYQPASEAEKKAIRSSGLYRYATNSGTASGSTKHEAILHAILELVERDAVGIQIVKTILKSSPCAVCVVDNQSLPAETGAIVSSVSDQADANVTIFEITTDLSVPAYLCSLESRESGKFRFFGSGASCLPAYAVERAVLESFQGYCLQFVFGKDIQPTPISSLPKSIFQRARLEHGIFAYAGGARTIELSASSAAGLDNISRLSCEGQVFQLAKHLEEKGIELFSRVIHEDEITVAQVVSPQLERFYLMTKGMPVGPGNRARTAYTT